MGNPFPRPRQRGAARVPPFFVDTGPQYFVTDPLLGQGLYAGQYQPTAGANGWTGFAPRTSANLPLLWTPATVNALSNLPASHDQRAAGFYYRPTQPNAYGKAGTLLRLPRAILFDPAWFGPHGEDVIYGQFFDGNGQTWDRANVTVWQNTPRATLTQFGWLDRALPYADTTHISGPEFIFGQALVGVVDPAQLAGGLVYEVYSVLANRVYWQGDPQGAYTVSTVLLNHYQAQAAAKVNQCAAYRCTVLLYEVFDDIQPANNAFNHAAYGVCQTVFSQIIGAVNNLTFPGAFQLVPAPGKVLQSNLNGAGADPVGVAAVNGLLPDIQQFFNIPS